MKNKKIIIYIICPFLSILFMYLLTDILNSAINDAPEIMKVVFRLIILIGFILNGCLMAQMVKSYDDKLSFLMASGTISVLIALVTFNIELIDYSFIPNSIDEYIVNYGYFNIIWAGIYLYNLICGYNRQG